MEFDGWINLKPLAKTNGKYGKLTTGGGVITGRRNSTDYFISGAYLGYEYKNSGQEWNIQQQTALTDHLV